MSDFLDWNQIPRRATFKDDFMLAHSWRLQFITMVKACVTQQGCGTSDRIMSRIWAYRMVLAHSVWVFQPQLAQVRSLHKRGWFPRWSKILPSWQQHCPEWKTLFDIMFIKCNTSLPFLFYSTLGFKFHEIPSHLTSMFPLIWVLSWKKVLREDQICSL